MTTMMESNTAASSVRSPINWCASQGDGVRLPAAGRMLDEIPLSGTVLARVGQQSAHHVELVVARPDLHLPLLARLRVRGLDDLRVVLQDVG